MGIAQQLIHIKAFWIQCKCKGVINLPKIGQQSFPAKVSTLFWNDQQHLESTTTLLSLGERKSFFANSVIVERGPLGNTPLFGMGLSCKMCACAPPPSPSWKKLQQWPWNCIAAVGTGTSCGSKGNSPPQPSPRPLSSSRSQIKAYQMEEEGELQFATAFFCTLLLPLQKRSLSPKKES